MSRYCILFWIQALDWLDQINMAILSQITMENGEYGAHYRGEICKILAFKMSNL